MQAFPEQYVTSLPLQLKPFQIKTILQKAAKWEINNVVILKVSVSLISASKVFAF